MKMNNELNINELVAQITAQILATLTQNPEIQANTAKSSPKVSAKVKGQKANAKDAEYVPVHKRYGIADVLDYASIESAMVDCALANHANGTRNERIFNTSPMSRRQWLTTEQNQLLKRSRKAVGMTFADSDARFTELFDAANVPVKRTVTRIPKSK